MEKKILILPATRSA